MNNATAKCKTALPAAGTVLAFRPLSDRARGVPSGAPGDSRVFRAQVMECIGQGSMCSVHACELLGASDAAQGGGRAAVPADAGLQVALEKLERYGGPSWKAHGDRTGQAPRPGQGQPQPARRIAVKVLDANRCGTSAEERFLREGELLCRLAHPGLVRGFGIGVTGDTGDAACGQRGTRCGQDRHGQGAGAPFIAMELIAGTTLAQALRDGRAFDARQALAFIRDIAAALHYMAMDGRVLAHRDIKPSNIMIEPAGQHADGQLRQGLQSPTLHPKLIDLGVAKTGFLAHDALGTRLVGTVHYMAPEQIVDSARADMRSDIFSLGIVLHEMLGCTLPQASERAAIAARFAGDVPALGADDASRLGLSRRQAALIDGLLARMCACEPHDRFQTQGQLVECIDGLMDMMPAGCAPPRRSARTRDRAVQELAGTASGRHAKRVSKRRMAAAGALVALVAATVAAGLAAGLGAPGHTSPAQAPAASQGATAPSDGSLPGSEVMLPDTPPQGHDIVLAGPDAADSASDGAEVADGAAVEGSP